MVTWYEAVIEKAKVAYYTSGSNIMTDEAYDKCEHLLKLYKLDSHVFEMVGYKMEAKDDKEAL